MLSEGLIPREHPHVNHLYSPELTSHMLYAAHDTYEQDESEDEISFDPDQLESFQNNHATVT